MLCLFWQSVLRLNASSGGLASFTVLRKSLNDASLQELFEPFKPESDVESSRDGSMGLRPCIARQIANAHGGGINAQSKNGEMVFAVQLPIANCRWRLAAGCWLLDAGRWMLRQAAYLL